MEAGRIPDSAVGAITRHKLDHLKSPDGVADVLACLYYEGLI